MQIKFVILEFFVEDEKIYISKIGDKVVKEKQGFVTDGCVEYHKGAEHLSDFAVFAEFSRPSGRTYFRFADKCTLF